MPLESSLGEEARYVSVSRGGGPGKWRKDVVPKGIIFVVSDSLLAKENVSG